MSDHDWRSGFVFVGNQLSLDFLNTALPGAGTVQELLPNGPAVARWLGAAGLVSRPQAQALAAAWAHEKDVHALHAFREALRVQVLLLEQHAPLAPEFVAELNELLRQYRQVEQVVESGTGANSRTWVRQTVCQPEKPADTLAVLASSTAALLTDGVDLTRVRRCEGCALHFWDTSRQGARRWCSMQMCGNRSKVAAFYRRHHRLG